MPDGTFFISDEYGPNLPFLRRGRMLSALSRPTRSSRCVTQADFSSNNRVPVRKNEPERSERGGSIPRALKAWRGRRTASSGRAPAERHAHDGGNTRDAENTRVSITISPIS